MKKRSRGRDSIVGRVTETEAAKIRRLAAEGRDVIGKMYGVTLVEGDLPDPVRMHPDDFEQRCHVIGMARARVQQEDRSPPPKKVKVNPAWLSWGKEQEEKQQEKAAKAEREKRVMATNNEDELLRMWQEEKAEKKAKEERERAAKEKGREKAIAQAVAETKPEPSLLEGITNVDELYAIEKRADEIMEEQSQGGGEEG